MVYTVHVLGEFFAWGWSRRPMPAWNIDAASLSDRFTHSKFSRRSIENQCIPRKYCFAFCIYFCKEEGKIRRFRILITAKHHGVVPKLLSDKGIILIFRDDRARTSVMIHLIDAAAVQNLC